MGCNDCHTPWKMGPQGPEPDMDRFLSGHPEQIGPLPNVKAAEPFLWSGFPTNTAFSGPWGVSYTFNLTPDQNTGLGIWTEEMFVRRDSHRPAHGRVAPHQSADAVAGVSERNGRRSESGLRVSADHQADRQPRA